MNPFINLWLFMENMRGKMKKMGTVQSSPINRDLSGRGTNLSAPSGHLPLKGEARLRPIGVAFLAPPLGELARSA